MRSHLLWTLLILFLGLGSLSANEQPLGISQYVRMQRADLSQLQTAIVTMRSPKGQRLDLVSAVHLADPDYYQQLNTKFRGYQVVLYELILPQEIAGQPLPAQLRSEGGLSSVQSTLARSLGLVTQLSSVDYSAANFVHADLTQEGLAKAMQGRNESLLSYVQKAMASSGGVSNLGVSEAELSELDLWAIWRGQGTPKDRKTLKKMMGTLLTSSDSVMAGMEDTAIVAERNRAALVVLDQELARGRTKLALFYGAAHMPELESSLRERGWKRTDRTWLTAWTF